MGFQLSPGVKVNEIDLTNIIPAVSTTGGAFVGQFHWGPVEDYTIVENRNQLEETFGKPSDVNYVDWFSAQNFLAYSTNLNIVRVVDANAKNASADGLGVLIKNEEHYGLVVDSSASAIIAAKWPGELGNSLEVHYADAMTFDDWEYQSEFDGKPGTSEYAKSLGAPNANDELHIVVVDRGGKFTGVPGAIIEKFSYVSKAADAKTLDGEPNFYGSILNKQSKYVWWLGNPTSGYGDDGAITAITVTVPGSGYTAAPSVTISGDGTGATAVANLSPTGEVFEINVTNGGSGYSVSDPVVITGDGTGATAEVASVDGSGAVTGITVTNGGTGYTSATADLSGSGDGAATADVVIGYSVASITITDGGSNYNSSNTVVTIGAPDLTGGTQAEATATVSANFLEWNESIAPNIEYKVLKWSQVPSGGGVNDGKALVYNLAGGADGNVVTSNELIAGWTMFENAEVVDVSLLFVGDAGGSTSSQTVIQHVIDNVAERRKDCIVFFSPDLQDVFNLPAAQATENVVAFRNNKINRSSSYAVMDSGWKYQYDLYNDKYRWVPLNADVAGLCANTDEVADPWYSPAGYTRGRIKNVISLALNPSKTNRDELYKAGVNPVVSFAGEGVVLYGDRTQQTKSSAFSKINIRRLFIVLEKAIATAAKYQLFEFNDQFTRAQFKNMVEPFLREVKGRRGIYDFLVVCDETNNTPEVIDRSEFVADIYIKPAYSINFITLNFVAVRTGVEFEEIVGLQK